MPEPDQVMVESVGSVAKPVFLPKGEVTNITLICTVTLPTSVDIRVNVSMQWTGPSYRRVRECTNVRSTCNRTVTLRSLEITKAGVYNCKALVTSPSNSFVTGTGSTTGSTTVSLCKLNVVPSHSIVL